jgi:hypothetical protein
MRLSVLPERVPLPQQRRVKLGGWLAAIRREVDAWGYFGGWRDARWGSSAIFVKELPDLAAVKAEMARIPNYDLALPLRAWEGRRAIRFKLTKGG